MAEQAQIADDPMVVLAYEKKLKALAARAETDVDEALLMVRKAVDIDREAEELENALGVMRSEVERMLDAQLPQRKIRVANFGWTSSSPLLSARRLEAIGDKYHPDVVAICIDMTDFGDDLRWGAMLEQRGVYRWHRWLPLAMHAFETWAPKAYRDFKFSSLGNRPRKRMRDRVPNRLRASSCRHHLPVFFLQQQQ